MHHQAMTLRLREIRKARGLTQEQVAADLSMDQGALSKIERGANTTTDTLKQLAEYYGVSMAALYAPKDRPLTLVEIEEILAESSEDTRKSVLAFVKLVQEQGKAPGQ